MDNRARFSFLFSMCSNPRLGLTEVDYESAAMTLGVEIEAIKAVAQVETMGNAYDDMGRPTILFERHHFHRHTAGRHDATHPNISNAQAGGYGRFNQQYAKLEEAYGLDEDAALKSASWGRFQIMGSNFRAAGFVTVSQFVLAMTESEAAQLRAFVSFVQASKPMLEALRRKDWAGFARRYNGVGYYKRGYDKKMEQAYNALAASRKKEATARP